ERRYTATARTSNVDSRHKCMGFFFRKTPLDRALGRLHCHGRTMRHTGGFEYDQFPGGQSLADLHLVGLDRVAEGALGQPDSCGSMSVEHQDHGMKTSPLQGGAKQERGVETRREPLLFDRARTPDLLATALETDRWLRI